VIVVGVDTGGTFTDFVCFDGKEREIFKVLSTPQNPAEAVLEGLGNIGSGEPRDIVHGSTVATNAILERKGAKTALITNEGFEDVIEIGRQNREKIYDLKYKKPKPIIPPRLRFGIRCRVLSTGRIYEDLDLDKLDEIAGRLEKLKVESVAVCFLFSFLNPDHELKTEKMLREKVLHCSLSHRILPEFREYERTATTALNAYVAPVMERYLSHFKNRLRESDTLRIMQSNGGSISTETASKESIRTILSGPAGGVIGAFQVAKLAGFDRIITFDMGGTSTDVSLVNRDVSLAMESKIAGYPVKVPMIDIHTVGAGGGSIAYIDKGGSLKVGPRSAGASPGPVCYGQGGTDITVTDANLFLGRLLPDHFLGGKMKLHKKRLNPFFQDMSKSLKMDPVSLALGILSVANATMEKAIRVISVERGQNPEEFVLVSFGGAGGLHAPFLAKNLSVSKVLVPENPGTLSALGMLMADVIKDYSRTIMVTGRESSFEGICSIFEELENKGYKNILREGVSADSLRFERFLDMRYLGQSHELMVPFEKNYIDVFHECHERIYGYKKPRSEVEIVNVRLRCKGSPEKPVFSADKAKCKTINEGAYIGEFEVFFGEAHPVKTLALDRKKLRFGNRVEGPAIIAEYSSTTVIPPGWICEVDMYKNLVISMA